MQKYVICHTAFIIHDEPINWKEKERKNGMFDTKIKAVHNENIKRQRGKDYENTCFKR